MDGPEIGDVIPIVFPGRREKWKKPERSYAQVLQVVELFAEPPEVPHPVGIAIAESTNMNFIDNRVLVPKRIALEYIASVLFLHWA